MSGRVSTIVITVAASTKINRMEMKGFKSFANKTTVEFGEDFNCILGPNGSGKSNVLDALCFVLGKAGSKSLRAEKTANLIYNGGKSKKPAAKGEVHIWFDNASEVFPVDDDEVKISRVVKKSGQSDYLINDETTTRTNIQDLLAHAKIDPDGYNIILQGDIVRLVEMSPNERREIIEEISGISIYEEKKTKAVRELERVEEQLKEADIVLKERETHLKELKKERDQALKFQELDEKIKRNKATILTRKQSEKQKKIDAVQEDIDSAQERIDAQQATIDELKKQILEKKQSIDAITRDVEEKGEKEQVALMKEAESIRVELARKEQREEQLGQELARIQDRRKSLESSKKETQASIKQLQKEVAAADKKLAARKKDQDQLQKKISSFREKNDLQSAAEVDERIHAIDEEAEQIQQDIQALREEQQELLRDKDKLEYQVQGIDERINKVLEAKKENQQQLKVLKNQRAELSQVKQKLDQALDRSSELVPEIQTAKGKLETREEELSKLRARQASIQERAAGSRAVKAILNLSNSKVYGTVAQLGKVSDQFSLALEIAAGGRLQSIVVADDSTAQECIEYLKKNQLGVANFLPLNKLRTRPVPAAVRSLKGSGVHGLALDLVSYDDKFEKAFTHVLGSTLVVEDISTARRVGIGKTRMVTVEGDLVESSGAMSGGYRKRKGSGAGFQEEELGQRLAKLEQEVADYQAVLSRLSSEKEELTEEIERLRSRRRELEDSVAQLERELHIDSADIDARKEDKQRLQEEVVDLEAAIDEVMEEIRSKNKDLGSLKSEKQELREKIQELRSPQAMAELSAFEQQQQQISEEVAEIRAEKRGFEKNIETIYEPELRSTEQILTDLDEEESSFTAEQEAVSEELVSMREELKEKEAREEAFRKQFKELFDKRSSLQEQKDALEEKTIKAEDKIRKSEHALSASSIQLASLKAELAGVDQELSEYAGVEPYKTKKDGDIQREVKEFERMVDNLGAVNMKALEVYERVEEEYSSLKEKKDTLTGEREDVLVMINEIDSKKRELFMKTFDAVEKHFKEIFAALSTKGEAFLELENPEDPLAEGLNIRVRLSGNKFMDIRSLSGGEKTMTALAFLYAIQEFEPASFYVLDEVDAALDKKNSERLAQLIREYSSDAQYVLISHNDTVISEADQLYGVSMDEHGISQVTSLKI